VEHCKESKFQNVIDPTRSLEFIQIALKKYERESMSKEYLYGDAFLVFLRAPMKEANAMTGSVVNRYT
jgi:hypothetical protein